MLRPSSLKRVLFFLFSDIILSLFTLYSSYVLRFAFYIDNKFLSSFFITFFILTSIKIISLFIFKVYFVVWRFFGFSDAKNIVKAHILAYSIFTILYLIFSDIFAPFPRSIIAIDFFLSLSMIGGLRILKRVLIEDNKSIGVMKPTLIIGVGSNTAMVIRHAMEGEIDYYPVAIVALEKGKDAINSYINNIKVYSFKDIASLVVDKNISGVIISRELSSDELKIVVDKLNRLGITDIKQMKMMESNQEKLEEISIEDLLARHPKDLDKDAIASFIKGKRVLITGAGGSIGSEITRQCYAFGAESLTLVDNSEFNLYQIGEEINSATLALVSVSDKESLDKVFREFNPQIVIHAAAYKHVPICEINQQSAIINNILGSINVMDSSILYKVDKVVIISTDKAVRPTNVMGTTKRIVELYANNVNSKDTDIVAVRFGNVLGSSGSVIPKFKKQIENGNNLTVTHPDITRYFMLISEACQLVLQTGAIAKGRELFVLDMGEPIKIVDLAKQMIRFYGKEGEIDIVFSGLRAGEKLYEELLIDESEKKTIYSSIFIAKPTEYNIDKLNKDIDKLFKAEDKIEALQNIVPEFKREL
jgi:UDP-N-acetyl-D-glucosamine 4,6-dehydratase